MPARTFFDYALWIWIAVAVISFPFLFLVRAPFGRHTNTKFGPQISNRLGWIIMESPAIWWFGGLFLFGSGIKNIPIVCIFLFWMAHYINRTLIYPFRLRTRGKKMPLLIVGSAFFFQFTNGYFNGHYLGSLSPAYPDDWIIDPRFISGAIVFITGMVINLWSDQVLLRIRKPGETHYQIPQGGLFRWISCPNFLGEFMEWGGFALMCWNLAGLSFFIWTIANLLPRALAHHQWYHEQFPEYPKERKAVITGIL